MIICLLNRNIESIDIFHVFLHRICLPEITNLVNSPVWLVVLCILFPNTFLYLLLCRIPQPVSCIPCQHFSFCAKAKVSKLFVIVGPIVTGRSKRNHHYNLSGLQLVYYTGTKARPFVLEKENYVGDMLYNSCNLSHKYSAI